MTSAVLLTAALAGLVAAEPQPCPDARGRHPIVEAGREQDVLALFAPHRLGATLAPGWTFDGVSITRTSVEARVKGPGDDVRVLSVRYLACAPDSPHASASFSFEPDAAGDPRDVLRDAVRSHDDGTFWQSWVAKPKQPRAPPPPPPPLWGSVAWLVLILALALLATVAALPALWRALELTRPNRWRVLAALAVVVVVAAVLRDAAGPTFIREAYALPHVGWRLGTVRLEAGIDPYPQGPWILVSLLGGRVATDMFEAWFTTHLLVGVLAIPWMFALVTLLTRSRVAGLFGAGLLATWPQHVVLSASESTHTMVVTALLAASTFCVLAARDGRWTSFAAACLVSASLVTLRPEAPLLLPPLAVLALWGGPELRRKLLRPERLAMVAVAVAAVLPVVLIIAGDASTSQFGAEPTHGVLERVGGIALALVAPDGRNAFLDPQITPVWLAPLAAYGTFRLWRDGQRGAAVGLVLVPLIILALFAVMPPAVTLWKMARYHASALPAVAALAAVGAWDLVTRVAHNPRPRAALATALAALSLAWWPAVAALPMDWQRSLNWTIDVGRRFPALQGDEARIVTPDNRRRFRDQSPRAAAVALSRGRQDMKHAVTVEEAIRTLRVGSDRTQAFWADTLFCAQAVLPGEAVNPQCAAMHRVFELKLLTETVIEGEPYLTAYEDVRGPVRLALYEIVGRRLSPEAGLKLLPPPIGQDARLPPGSVHGSATPSFMEPAVPPVGDPLWSVIGPRPEPWDQ